MENPIFQFKHNFQINPEFVRITPTFGNGMAQPCQKSLRFNALDHIDSYEKMFYL